LLAKVKNISAGIKLELILPLGQLCHTIIFTEAMNEMSGKTIVVFPYPKGCSPWNTLLYKSKNYPFVFHSTWLEFVDLPVERPPIKKQDIRFLRRVINEFH